MSAALRLAIPISIAVTASLICALWPPAPRPDPPYDPTRMAPMEAVREHNERLAAAGLVGSALVPAAHQVEAGPWWGVAPRPSAPVR